MSCGCLWGNTGPRYIARQKETWWRNEEVAALIKEKQLLFKLWKGRSARRVAYEGKQEGENCAGVGERLETRGVARTWTQGGRTTTWQRVL